MDSAKRPSQAGDSDGDGLLDDCDPDPRDGPDADVDGVVNEIDNCPLTANEDQADSSSSGIGDICNPLMTSGPQWSDAPTEGNELIVADDSYATDEDVVLVVPAPGVLNNDSHSDGGELSVVAVDEPLMGELTVSPDGSVEYVPLPDWSDLVTVEYTVSDSAGVEASASIDIAVTPVNDPPSPVDDSATTTEDVPVSIAVLDDDTDVDGDELEVVSVTGAEAGTASVDQSEVRYAPDTDWCGTEELTYRVQDLAGSEATATVTINVECINDPPIAADDSFRTDEDVAISVSAPGLLANDADGEALTVVDTTQPERGTLTFGAEGSLEFVPPENWFGTTTFSCSGRSRPGDRYRLGRHCCQSRQ